MRIVLIWAGCHNLEDSSERSIAELRAQPSPLNELVDGSGSRSVTRSRTDKGGRAIRPPPGELLYNEIRVVENAFADFAATGKKYVSIVASRATCWDVYSELPPVSVCGAPSIQACCGFRPFP